MNPQQNQHDEYFKIIVVGNSGTGKTNIVHTFSKGIKPNHTAPTIGIDYCSKIIKLDNNRKIKMQIWDTAGHQLYRSLSLMQKQHYRNASGAFAVFDITNRNSFNDLQKWIADVRQHANQNVVIAILANKIDLKNYRCISFQQASSFASNQGTMYMQTTIQDPQSLQLAFQRLAQQINKSNKTKNLQFSRSVLGINPTQTKNQNNCNC